MPDRSIVVLRRDAPMAIRVPYSRHRYAELLPETERTSSRLDTVEAVLYDLVTGAI
jgi:hypothetical protein